MLTVISIILYLFIGSFLCGIQAYSFSVFERIFTNIIAWSLFWPFIMAYKLGYVIDRAKRNN